MSRNYAAYLLGFGIVAIIIIVIWIISWAFGTVIDATGLPRELIIAIIIVIVVICCCCGGND